MAPSRATMAAIRFGYGFHPDQTPPRGPEDLLSGLDRAARTALIFPVQSMAGRQNQIAELRRRRRAKAPPEDLKQSRQAMRRQVVREGTERLFQRALSPHGFYERMAAFWADHFTVSGRNPGQALLVPGFEPIALRPHITGRFGDMLVAAVRHPAMLTYLDQVVSIGPNSVLGKRTGKGLNENLARELLELHTLGVGAGYTQGDVRGLAGLLTGYGVDRGTLGFSFHHRRAEPGPHRVLGRSYGSATPGAADAEAFLQDVAVHADTARHMALKLARHFTADQPEPALVRHMTRAWTRSQGALPEVYGAMLEHPATWESFGQKVKQPEDLVISTLRAAGLTRAEAREMGPRGGIRIVGALRNLNQPLYRPPGPDGWPEEAEAWISPQGLAGRLEFAGQVGQRLAKRSAIDPRTFARQALRDALRPATAFAVGAAPERWEGIALALASPEFNRR